MMKKIIMMIFVLAFVFAMNVQAVHATPILTLSDGVNPPISITDNLAGDIDPLLGVITFSGPLGAWIVNVTTGITMPVIGSSTSPTMDLNSVNVSSVANGILQISFTESGFTYNGALTSSVGGTTSGTTNFMTLINGIPIDSLGPFAPIAFSGTTSTNALLTPTDTLTLYAFIYHPNTGNTSFDYQVNTVPEPGTLLLLGTGLIGIGVYRWRRMKKQK